MREPVVRIQGLVKSFRAVRALDGLTLDLPPGAVGLLGPNGAGKTTLLKLLLGLLRPSAGSAKVLGLNPERPAGRLELRRRVGYMPEGDCLLPGRTAVELVTVLARLTGLTYADAITRAHEMLDYVGIDEARYRQLDEYSTGMKQRLKLAQVLVHDPPLILLDEPTNGLDPKGRREMLELVHDLGHEQGKHVLLCSHLLPDVERTCDHVVVLSHGRAVTSGEIAQLTREDSSKLRVSVGRGEHEFAAALGEQSIAFERETGGEFRIELHDGTSADDLFGIAAAAGAPLTRVEPVRSSLEEVFMSALEESAPEESVGAHS